DREGLHRELEFQKIAKEFTRDEEIELIRPDNPELSVGNEWQHFKYIPGVNLEKETGSILYAVWRFDDLPGVLARRPRVRCEYKFDISRGSKGKEGEPVRCSLFLYTRYFNPTGSDRKDYSEASQKLLMRPQNESEKQAQQQFIARVLPHAPAEVVSRLSAGTA